MEAKETIWGIIGTVITIIVLACAYVVVQQGVFEDHDEIVEVSFSE